MLQPVRRWSTWMLAAAGPLVVAVPMLDLAPTAGSTMAPSIAPPAVDARHLHLVRAFPTVDSTFTGSPNALCLWFSERVNLKATAVTVTDQAGNEVQLSPLSLGVEAKAPVVAKVLQPLAPGKYTVSWRAMGRDSHIVKNTYSFTLAAMPPARED